MKRKNKKKDESYLPGSRVKLKFRQHFLPPLVGITAMFAVWGLFNTQMIAAKISQHTYKPPVISVPENSPVDPNPKVIINDIGVNAPVIYNLPTVDENAFQLALRDGVVHYPNTALPGKPGNVVIFGHSSGQVWAPGNYKFVFTHLEKLNPGQKIYLEYEGARYIYAITDKKVVAPTLMSVLNPTNEPTLTLITCTPVGTSKNRLIVTAKQIVPNPTAESLQRPGASPISEINQLPNSNSPSFWGSLFDRF